MRLSATFPIGMITFGFLSAISLSKRGRHSSAAIIQSGLLLGLYAHLSVQPRCGGGYQMVFVTVRLSRSMPIKESHLLNTNPAAPENGFPVLTSSRHGESPMTRIPELPEPSGRMYLA